MIFGTIGDHVNAGIKECLLTKEFNQLLRMIHCQTIKYDF